MVRKRRYKAWRMMAGRWQDQVWRLVYARLRTGGHKASSSAGPRAAAGPRSRPGSGPNFSCPRPTCRRRHERMSTLRLNRLHTSHPSVPAPRLLSGMATRLALSGSRLSLALYKRMASGSIARVRTRKARWALTRRSLGGKTQIHPASSWRVWARTCRRAAPCCTAASSLLRRPWLRETPRTPNWVHPLQQQA
ncbi:hypothetical protein L1887_46836 [Cichorium endivia]|nr:hypothetical protein L1887_46836 [Cichorium endivia]